MTLKVAINGFGRIGRLVLRAIHESGRGDIEVVAINDLADAATNARLLKYDSVHGRFPADVVAETGIIIVGGRPVRVTAERDPAKLPHAALDVDIALECTGIFADAGKAAAHLAAGARRVLISAPITRAESDTHAMTVVYGVNHRELTAAHTIVSNASCTTNCLAPVAKVLDDSVGIERGLMTTIHSYTNDQNVLDQMHKDPRRSRAAAINMIPTSTGAARALGEVLPRLKGRLDGSAVRVPTPNVSLIDLTFVPGRDTSAEEINAALKAAADGPMAGILAYTDQPLVSSDFNHDPASSTVDALETTVLGGKLVRVVSWYDNEWGFSNRMLDTAVAMGRLI